MPVVKKYGVVEGQTVSVLRDSGCSGVVVRKDLVSNNQMTDRVKTCVLIDGTIRKVPVAVIDVDTPYYSGEVEALCMNNPVYDLILGNIDGVRCPTEPDLEWSCSLLKKQTLPAKGDVIVCDQDFLGLAVETRSQSKAKGKSFKELKVPVPLSEIVTPDILRDEAQKNDVTLHKVKELAESGDEKLSRKGGMSEFVIHTDGILYRKFQSPVIEFGEPFHQVVAPVPFRQPVMKLAHKSILEG